MDPETKVYSLVTAAMAAEASVAVAAVVVGISIIMEVEMIGMNPRLRFLILRSISCIRCCRGSCSRIACISHSRKFFELFWMLIGKRFLGDWRQFADSFGTFFIFLHSMLIGYLIAHSQSRMFVDFCKYMLYMCIS